ncbi:hypothetical protein BDA96_05G195100 [Sorghum bicolor]|uniref:Uncharacterized protein n=1 Tax=Sorghum bicolor TaxID=4558 RepID=A0A921QZA0_SORBI|nr:hypothetical protein BDA96_05G195100 [Sorghum bicolor]
MARGSARRRRFRGWSSMRGNGALALVEGMELVIALSACCDCTARPTSANLFLTTAISMAGACERHGQCELGRQRWCSDRARAQAAATSIRVSAGHGGGRPAALALDASAARADEEAEARARPYRR